MLVRLGVTSDTHIGLTKEKSIRKMFLRMKERGINILVLAGDFNGGRKGYRAVRTTVKLAREIFPEIPIVVVLGNHDYWHEGRKRKKDDGIFNPHSYMTGRKYKPSITTFNYNYQQILKAFEENNIHFLDEDGIFRCKDFPGLALVGHSGWYHHVAPPTNDELYLPLKVEGDTNRWMEKNARQRALDNLEGLAREEDTSIIYVSHFPILNPHDEALFSFFSGDENLGDFIRQEYNPCAFINGHAHRRHEGEKTGSDIRFECGSDYFKPRELYLEVDLELDICTAVD